MTEKKSTETVEDVNVYSSIAARLTAVMEDVGAVGKEGRNAQQGFNFRGVDAVVKAVAPALRKYGIVVMPYLLEKSTVESTTRNGGSMETVYLTVQYTLTGPDGDSVVGVVAAQANDTADKATAKAMSVAYRTFWLQALCIPTDDPDPDSSYTERGAPLVAALTKQQADEIVAYKNVVNLPETFEKVLGRKATARDMTFVEAEAVINHLKTLPDPVSA